MTIAHRRAVDRARSEAAAAAREARAASAPALADQVAEAVESSLEAERVSRCLDGLTELQRESITLGTTPGTATAGRLGARCRARHGEDRIRDGLKRLRDCLGVSW